MHSKRRGSTTASSAIPCAWSEKLGYDVLFESPCSATCAPRSKAMHRGLASVTYTNVDPKPPTGIGMHRWHKVSCGETV